MGTGRVYSRRRGNSNYPDFTKRATSLFRDALAGRLAGGRMAFEDLCLHDAKSSWYPFDDVGPVPTAPDGTPLQGDDGRRRGPYRSTPMRDEYINTRQYMAIGRNL